MDRLEAANMPTVQIVFTCSGYVGWRIGLPVGDSDV